MSHPSPAEAPNGTAPGQARAAVGRGPCVGVLTPLSGGFFWGEIITGIVREVAAAGGSVVLIQTLEAGQTRATAYPLHGTADPVGWDHIDGFVSMLRATDEKYLQRVRAIGKPVVIVSERGKDVDAACVTVDNASAIHEAVDHLVEHGHTRIGFLGFDGHSDIRERYEAYREAMVAHGLEPYDRICASGDVEESQHDAAAVAAADPAWTAIIAGTDRNAWGLIAGLRELGVHVPRDMAVIGFDDLESSWRHDPPLTTARQDFTELGVAAGRLILAELKGDPPEHRRHTVPARLVLRASCGCGLGVSAPGPDLGASADAVVAQIAQAVGYRPGRPWTGGELDDAARIRLDAAATKAIAQALRTISGHENSRTFLYLVIERLTRLVAECERAGERCGEWFAHAAGQVGAGLIQAESTASLTRSNGMMIAYDRQFSIGMDLLSQGDGDVAELGWMAKAGIKGGCVGLWDGPPEAGRMVIAGVHGVDGRLDGYVGTELGVGQFPPRELVECADTAAGEVTYAVPIRGVSGNHGYLCVIGVPECDAAVTRGDFDHWTALLGEKLREKRLVAEIRHSEERYAFAARAANDGLLEWTTGAQAVYLSPRCREMLGVGPDEVATPDSLTARIHPSDRKAVLAAVTSALEEPDVPVELECRLKLPGGERPWLLVRALGVARDDGSTGLVGSVANIDKRKTLEERLRRAAMVDEVTGLPNRRFFLERLRHGIGRGARGADAWFAVLFLDLDGFKLINDSLGHLAGDELLRVVGDRLRATLRATDTAARFGGDEFAILLADQMPEDLLAVAQRVQERITAPVTLGNHQVRVTASIGITTSATQYVDPEDVLRDADIAMYRAKEDEGGGVRFFDMSMHQSAIDRLRLRGELGAALQNHEFVVHYQPIVDLADTTVHRFEALTRWQHPTRGLLGPGEFLPAMEGSDAIVALDRLVLDEVCAQIVRWRADSVQPVHVSVNVSHRTFWSEGFLDTVQSTLDRHGVPPECVNLELTENIIMTDPDLARATMAGLRDIGVGLYIDDFGTGHSSLHLLRTFPLDTLKIAGPFVSELTEIAESAALVQAIITMASALGMSTVAECVETVEQAERLRELGCTSVQGWLYARAMSAEDATALLGTRLDPKVPISD